MLSKKISFVLHISITSAEQAEGVVKQFLLFSAINEWRGEDDVNEIVDYRRF